MFVTIIGLGGDGLVPVSTLGAERFSYDEKAQALVGDQTGERYVIGRLLDMRLAEANPLTGALKFEPVDSDGGRVEARGRRGPQGKPVQGKRGRPGNIRHQGKRR